MLSQCGTLQMNRYKVFFHSGDELTLKTRVTKGDAWVDVEGLHVVDGSAQFFVRREDVRSVELFRLHGLGRVVRVNHAAGTLFLSVVRLMVGQFALINFFQTGALKDAISALAEPSR